MKAAGPRRRDERPAGGSPVRLAGVALAALAAACASSTQAPSAGGGPEGRFRAGDALTREIAPFPVRDAAGRAYDHPFLGGFDVPRPQLVDIDGDGDNDLFIQERTDELIFFENVGTAGAPRYTWRTSRYQDLEVGEWSRFHDLDDDGDLDLLAETPFSYIRYIRNEGTPTEPRLVVAADSLRDADGEPIFSDRQNIPNMTDIDCDGAVDLFLGRVDGTVTRYEEVSVDARGIPSFALRNERFEDIEIVAAIAVPGGPDQADAAPGLSPAAGTRLHGANSMAFADVDEDGDQDFFWGDFFEAGLLWIENLGSCERPDLRATPQPVPADELITTSGYNVATLADQDADGDLDMLIGVLGGAFNPNTTASDNLIYFERLPSGDLTRRASRYLYGIDVGSESMPAFGDLDGDGDQDLLVGSKLDPTVLTAARLYRFENVGSTTAPEFVLTDTLAPMDAFHLAPELADLDGDGDLDMLLGSWNDDIRYLRNEGTAEEPDFVLVGDGPIAELPRGSHATPGLGDLDGDGDLDLLVGESSGEINQFRNVGEGEPVFELVTEGAWGIDVGRRSVPSLVDLDGDGDLDLIVGREDAGAEVFMNQGSPREPDFVPAGLLDAPLPHFSTPVLLDLDGDGDDDLVSGGMGGGLVFFRNGRIGGGG
ncbi:MAG TPA: FG-GAP-like repeat-containing protein [Longimicrobiales bacterium]|nr:FG-GAP-like repeat-containing protein [Longimicrobiales bacterium]